MIEATSRNFLAVHVLSFSPNRLQSLALSNSMSVAIFHSDSSAIGFLSSVTKISEDSTLDTFSASVYGFFSSLANLIVGEAVVEKAY